MSSVRLGVLRALAVFLLFGTASAQAPRLGKTHDDAQNGLSFRVPDDWEVIPVQPDQAEAGLILRMQGAKTPRQKLLAFRLPHPGEVGERPDVVGRLGWFLHFPAESEPEVDEDVRLTRGLNGHRRQYVLDRDVVEVWGFEMEPADVFLVYVVEKDDKYLKRWVRTFEHSAKSLEVRAVAATVEPSSTSSYADLLRFHDADARRAPGWRALPTPSEKFIVKTSSEDEDFIEEVVERLERSREIFERDFPPETESGHVSVVRICGSEAEFHRYGGTSKGVAGWFNPSSTELVLYDAKNVDRNMSFAVMSHEAFHQYCYFLFGRAEAHRWFDEGHGDYYGGLRLRRGKAEITPKMPGGLERLTVIREMLRAEEHAPLASHLNFTHREWQGQGPKNVSPYAQSWSIVYMLRQGALGEVPRKLWKPEYGDIIPNYVRELRRGYEEAYREALPPPEPGRTKSRPDPTELPPIGRERKQRIWTDAMKASWGAVDLEQFEEDWIRYVLKELD